MCDLFVHARLCMLGAMLALRASEDNFMCCLAYHHLKSAEASNQTLICPETGLFFQCFFSSELTSSASSSGSSDVHRTLWHFEHVLPVLSQY